MANRFCNRKTHLLRAPSSALREHIHRGEVLGFAILLLSMCAFIQAPAHAAPTFMQMAASPSAEPDDKDDLPGRRVDPKQNDKPPAVAPAPPKNTPEDPDEGADLPARPTEPNPFGPSTSKPNASKSDDPAAILKSVQSPFSASTGPVVYYPMAAFGKASAKEKLFLIWNASQQSADAFNKLIVPLIGKTRGRQDRLIVLLEDLKDPASVHRPELPFFCAANPRQYASLILRYMSGPKKKDDLHPSTADPAVSVNKAMEKALAKERLKLDACLKDPLLYQRAAFAASYVATIKDHFHIEGAPMIVWHDRAMPANRSTIREIRKAWR